MENPTKKLPDSTVKRDKTLYVRVTDKTRALVAEILEKVNAKEHGRIVKSEEVIGLALSLLGAAEIKKLQEASLTNSDRLELSYQSYIKSGIRITKDEYIGRLLSGEINSSATDK